MPRTLVNAYTHFKHLLGRRSLRLLCVGLCLLLGLIAFSLTPVNAQVVGFKKVDVNSTTAGSYSFASGQYVVNGAGSGVGTGDGLEDSFTMANYPATGNVEIIGKLVSESGSGINSYSQAGLMIRADDREDVQSFFVGVSPSGGNGINFVARTKNGDVSTTTLGPSIGPGVWLRLVKSGNDIAAFQSADACNWSLVGQTNAALPATFEVGLAVSSNSPSTLSSGTFENVRILTEVPQRNQNMLLWLRSDVGVQYTDAVNRWVDQSAFGNDAVGTGSNRPTLSTNVISGGPVVNFSRPSSQFLAMPAGFDDFSQGASVYAVVKHSGSTGAIIASFGFAGGADSFYLDQGSATTMDFVSNGPSGTATFITGSGFSTSAFQLVENTISPDDGFGNATASMWRNGVLKDSQSGLWPILSETRTKNELGRSYNDALYFSGQLAEVIVLSKEATTAERQSIERYVQAKYGFGSNAMLSAPVISPGNSVVTTAPYQVTMTSDPGTIILYTDDGSDPSPSSSTTQVYKEQFAAFSTKTYRAISVGVGFSNSPVAKSTVEVEPEANRILLDGLKVWLRSTNGVGLNGSSAVSSWADVSGSGNDFSQSNAAKQPVFNSADSSILNRPSIQVTGTQSLFNTNNLHAWNGTSIFVVLNPTATAPSGTPRFLDFGNGVTNSDNFGLSQPALNDFRYFAYNGSTIKNCTFTSGLASSYRLIEATEDNTSLIATVLKNGTQGSQTTAFSVLNDVQRSANAIGASSADSLRSEAKFAEIIVFDRQLTDIERRKVEGFLLAQYHLGIGAPIITPSGGMNANTAISIDTDPGATVYYTLDGTTPTTSSIKYTGPIGISAPVHIRAIATQTWWGGTNPESEAYIGADSATGNIPTSGLQMWLRSDAGVVSATPPVIDSWLDRAVSSHGATGSGSNKPTLVGNVLRGLPAVNFSQSPTAQFLTPNGTYDFSGGFSSFVVTNLNAADGQLLSFDQTSNGKFVRLLTTSTGNLQFSVKNSGTAQTASQAVTFGFPQLFEAVQSSGSASLYRNGAQLGSAASVVNSNATTDSGKISNTLTSQFFEILVYNRPVTTFERQTIEAYLLNRYGLTLAPIADPVFSIASGTTLSAPSQLVVNGPLGAVIRYETNGSTPTLSSPVLTGPLPISYSQTVKAIAVLNNMVSNVVTASYTLDPMLYPSPSTVPVTAPTINLTQPTPAQ